MFKKPRVKLTNQYLISKATDHLLKQGIKSYSQSTGACYYRYKGLKCGVGALIKDKHYDSGIESESVTSCPLVMKGVIKSLPFWCETDGSTVVTLSKIQKIHDRSPVDTWKDELDALKQVGVV